jgi:two-component system, LytTR family, response regulator
MNVVIIEDEKIAADHLENLIREIDPGIVILDRIDSIKKAVDWFMNNNADLIFLDIHLSDGTSFKIFEQVEIKTPVIFTTAFDQYAIKAFNLNSVDYLLKPIEKDHLKHSIDKYKELFTRKHEQSIDFSSLLKALGKKQDLQERFLIQSGRRIKTVKIREIAYFYSTGKDTFLCTWDNKNYSIDYSLDKIENLVDPDIYFRINRKFIVHLDAIKNMYVMSKSHLKLEIEPKPEEDTLVSFDKSADFRRWLNK